MKNIDLKNILVTGCGGDIAIAMARILRDILPGSKLIGTEIHDDHPAAAFFDEVLAVVRADHPEYQACMEAIVQKNSIDLLIPSTEAEIDFITQHGPADDVFGVPVLMANKYIVEIGLDKLKTADYLRAIDCLSPWTLSVDKGKPVNFPCIIKPRKGCGSKNIAIVKEENESDYSSYGSDYIWQEYLYPDDEEYTCGLYRSKHGDIRSIVIKRQLQGGLTGKGVIVDNSSISQLLEHIARGSGLIGSVNVQLRLTSTGPTVFEINPRFSSTVMFRHKLGFKDLLWAIEDKFDQKLSAYVTPESGVRFYRVSDEVII